MRLAKLIHPSLAALLVLVAPALAADPLTNGLVAYWPLNKLQGDTVKDVGPKGYDAMAEELKLVEGRGAKVAAFDGLKSGMIAPNEPEFDITGDYSVSFWIRVDPDVAKDGPIVAQPGFSISNFKGTIRVTFRSSKYPSTGYADLMGPTIKDGAWHHVVFSYDSTAGIGQLFVDVNDAGTGKFPHLPEEKDTTTIGWHGRFRFQGELSDLRIYARYLDERDVAKLNNAPLPN